MEIARDLDYAPHYLRAKELLRSLYELLNDREMEKAEQISLQLLAEAKLLHNAVKVQK